MILGNHFSYPDMIWDKKTESIYAVDFEHIGYGPIVSDVILLFCQLSEGSRLSRQDQFLKAYHEKLTELGKIDTSVYTLEKLTRDYKKFFLPASVNLLCKFNVKGNKGLTNMFVKNTESFLKDVSIDEDNLELPIIIKTQILEKPKADDFDLQMETG